MVGGIILISLSFKTVNAFKKSIFDGQNRITLVLEKDERSDMALVFSLAPKEGSISLLIIPGNANVQVPKNFGKYQLGNVYELGKLGSRGGELLRETTQNFIGAPVDGWIVINSKFKMMALREQNLKLESDEIRTLVKNSLSITNILGFLKSGGLDTNLTFLDILRIWYQARQVRLDKIEAVNLEDLNILEKTQLLDGTEIFEIDPKVLDQISFSLFNERQVLNEKKTVEIMNGTEIPGLGSDVARLITNMGAEVISIKNSREKIGSSSIIVSRESYTASRISKSLGFPLVRKKNKEEGDNILILLGEN